MRYTEEMQLTLDIDWFAIDKEGNVAHFASAGGVLPESVCTSKEDNERLLEFFKSLPITNKDVILNDEMIKSKGLMTMEDVERHFRDFIFMSHRGLFSFDKKVLGQFEDAIMLLVSKPLSPLNVNDLPIDIQKIVSRTKVDNDLNEVKEIDVATVF